MSPTDGFGPIPERVRMEAADWFARLRGPGAEALRPEFEAWRASPECARAYEQLCARWEQSGFIGATATGRARTLRRASPVARHPMLSAAAALVLLVAGAILFLPILHQHAGPSGATQSAFNARFETASAVRIVALTDGSRLILDHNSLVSVAYAPTMRAFTLERGRARFDVAHDVSRPFRVVAGATAITAHGTLFDVALADGTATVTLLKGSIGVEEEGHAGTVRILRPGQRIVAAPRQPLPPAMVAPADVNAWLPAMVSFDDIALAEAASRIERGTTSHILFTGDAAVHRITGTFRAGDVDAFAKAAASLFDLSMERAAGGAIQLSPMAKPRPKIVGG